MTICLKIPYYFYTNLNFQRPISHLILIWDPLKFYHFWTLQIKLSNFGRSTPPKGWISVGGSAYKRNFPKCMALCLKNSFCILYKFKFSDLSHSIIWDSIKFLSFFGLCNQTDHLWQIYSPLGLVSLGEGLQSLFL